MHNIRQIKQVWHSKPTIEGAGVHLKRAFGYPEVPLFDPFLLLDDFHSDRPRDYLAGFPWHPHRGIETVTYMLHGNVEHGDSMGNRGVIGSGDVQWMTAGSGIVHQEMPKQTNRLLWGFQLWVNLPASHKMMPPRYRDITSDQIPEVALDNGIRAKVICGTIAGVSGPAQDIVVDSEYLDVVVPAETTFAHHIKPGYNAFAYILEGQAYGDDQKTRVLDLENLILFEQQGEQVIITTTEESARFLLISGKPLGEPVAWHGPIVMNTRRELEIAFEEYRAGTFLKHQ